MDRKQLYDRTVKIFLVGFVLMMICLTGVYTASTETKDALEFYSYIAPCAAGVFAGAGLYFQRERENAIKASSEIENPQNTAPANTSFWPPSERFFYMVSVLLLFAGLFTYVLGHRGCQNPAIAVIGLCFSAVALISYTFCLSSDSSNSKFLGIGALIWAGAIFVVPILTLVCIYCFGDFFSHINGTFRCWI